MPESGYTFMEDGRSCNRADAQYLDLNLDYLALMDETLAARRPCELPRRV